MDFTLTKELQMLRKMYAFSCCNGSGDSSSRKFCHTCHHRKKTVSHSLNSISQHIDKIQRNKEQCHTFYIDCYHGKHFFNIIRDKQICEIFSRKEQKTSYNNRIYNSYKMRSPESFAHSFKFSGSDVLGSKTGQTISQSGQ